MSRNVSPIIFAYNLKYSTRPFRCLDVSSIFIFATGDVFCEIEVLVIFHTLLDLVKLSSWNMGVLMLIYVWRWKGKDEESDSLILCCYICPLAALPYCTVTFVQEDIGGWVWILSFGYVAVKRLVNQAKVVKTTFLKVQTFYSLYLFFFYHLDLLPHVHQSITGHDLTRLGGKEWSSFSRCRFRKNIFSIRFC